MNFPKLIPTKLLLLIFVLTLGHQASRAQLGEPRRAIAIGFSAGTVLNTIQFEPTIKQFQHVAPTVGLTARFTSEKYFSVLCALQVELNYSVLGWKENILDANTQPLPDSYRRDIHYLQMPFLARIAYGREQKGIMGFIVAGPQIGYALSEKEKMENFTLDDAGNPMRPNNMYKQYGMKLGHKFEYGITGGLGMEFNTKVGHFILEGRYTYGLSDIYKNSKKDVFESSNHQTITAKLTYLFDIRK